MSNEINVGHIKLGGSLPVRLQSMTNTSTLDVQATVEQCLAIANAGADLVRITAQGLREAEALQHIRQMLRNKGCSVPLVADIHFNPAAAEVAAQHVEKVRINPGNFVDRGSATDEPTMLREKFVHLIKLCKAHHTALRVGVNHGSLSARMTAKFGDTPHGMVESAMEFLRICCDEKFRNVVVSMKSSNTRVMVYATRLLALRMACEGMGFPLHLGVTEAGEGEDGRIKSAVGIGSLLAEGLGDTIRVSLTEDPQNEIPVAKQLVEYIASPRIA
ncbi:MAG: (E)-4-hydroxy-3-methylbut-2-enyl-diphosphate synthase, partial [Prevotellaceae bacterium]|nr:(E)-4-hydroxy-3-methylbut-2-enyl-diphosphate synthase [Prevotellaceae bacterium]